MDLSLLSGAKLLWIIAKVLMKLLLIDISAKDASLKDMPDINSSHMKKLSNGKNKIRLNLLLSEGNESINTFACLVWSQTPEEKGIDAQHYGFEFIDIPGSAFKLLKKFIDSESN